MQVETAVEMKRVRAGNVPGEEMVRIKARSYGGEAED